MLGNVASLRPFAFELVLAAGVFLLLAVVMGAGLRAAATDLLTVTLSIELVSILSYVLAAFSRRTSRSAEAGLKYVIYGGVATGTMLYGFSLLYGLAGSTGLAATASAVPPTIR